ncbi:Hypothetical protein A7982_04071 [Minicystis rosea]|nr:Hypothetical protein A7982_04071 [Minicystis rosea]
MDVSVLHDGSEAARSAEARITAAGHRLVPPAEGQVILMLLPTARAAAQALATSVHARALCAVDLGELQLDAITGALPLLSASWIEEQERHGITVSGPLEAYRHAHPVLTAIAPTEHAPEGHGFLRVHAAEAPLYQRWLEKRVTLDDVERKSGIVLEREHVAKRWHEAMTHMLARLPFPQRAWAEATVAAAMREKRAPFGYLYLEWQGLKRKMLDGDELWTFDSGKGSWESMMGCSGLALVRRGEVVVWMTRMVN